MKHLTPGTTLRLAAYCVKESAHMERNCSHPDDWPEIKKDERKLLRSLRAHFERLRNLEFYKRGAEFTQKKGRK